MGRQDHILGDGEVEDFWDVALLVGVQDDQPRQEVVTVDTEAGTWRRRPCSGKGGGVERQPFERDWDLVRISADDQVDPQELAIANRFGGLRTELNLAIDSISIEETSARDGAGFLVRRCALRSWCRRALRLKRNLCADLGLVNLAT